MQKSYDFCYSSSKQHYRLAPVLAKSINILSRFLGRRDIPELTQSALQNRFGFSQADAMVLFGGSILKGGDVLADAMKNNVAKTYLIVGGVGHTTPALRKTAKSAIPSLDTSSLTEAEIFQAYLKEKYSLSADYLETDSTHCGNNITNLLVLFEQNSISPKSLILTQDATMQLRMHATLKKYRPDIQAINFASYEATVIEKNNAFSYSEDIPGMWPITHYVKLLLGEIQRLTDDEHGYGPRGKNFLAHTPIPKDVQQAYKTLLASGLAPR